MNYILRKSQLFILFLYSQLVRRENEIALATCQRIASPHLFDLITVPRGTRTPVTAVKGRCPGPLDDGDIVIVDCRMRIVGCEI